MSDALERYEQALADLIAEWTTGDETRWPVVGWVTYALTTDPESMTMDEPELITPTGQRPTFTRGLLQEALDQLKAETAPVTAMVSWEPAEDDDDDE